MTCGGLPRCSVSRNRGELAGGNQKIAIGFWPLAIGKPNVCDCWKSITDHAGGELAGGDKKIAIGC